MVHVVTKIVGATLGSFPIWATFCLFLQIGGTVALSEPKSPSKPARIGAILPLTGFGASFGTTAKLGIEKGRAPGPTIVYEDDACEPSKALSAFKKLVDLDGVHLLLGPVCGSSQEAIAPLLRRSKVLVVALNSASRKLYKISGENFFSTQYAIEDEARFNAQAMYADGKRKVVLLFFDNQFSRAHESAFRKEFKAQVLETISYSAPDPEHVKTAVLRLKSLSADALYVPDASPFYSGLITMMRKMGIDLPVYSVFSVQSQEVLTAEGKNAEGLVYSYPKIAEQDAISYFPEQASRILTSSASACGEEIECIKKMLRSNWAFDIDGVLQNSIVLKTVRNGTWIER